ncbi:hypothetical protein BSKO_10241 [Bryopsis sp. KO-2023]|nr:hypothetical protein BSKO_10241 [Bryopsis sp. KO-2023]
MEENQNDDSKLLEDAKKLPMSQRVEHKNWKVRVAAYEDIKSTCSKVMGDDDPVLSEYGRLLAKSVVDMNAPALDKALEAYLEFLSKCSVAAAASICDKTCSSLFTKAMNGRPGTVVKATQVFLCFVELEQAEKVVEHISAKGLSHKVPKVIAASVDVLYQAVSAFGTKVVAPQLFLKSLPPLFESRDAKTREKVKATTVELSRWVGATVVEQLLFTDAMRSATKDELSKLMAETPAGKPTAERLIRSEQLKLLAKEADGDAMEEDVVEEEEDVVPDVFDLSAPANILGELNKEWWAALQEKKWITRKGSLTKLKDLASKPRLATGDYSDVLRELKKVITKDSNVQCVAEAAACVGQLGQGLRQDFTSGAKQFCSVLLGKFKEKNPVVNRMVPEALELLHKHCFVLMDVIEDVLATLEINNPKIRGDTLAWLKKCAAFENKDTLNKVQAQLVPAVAKLADDATPAVRENALGVLVEFCLKATGVAQIEKIVSKVADNRTKKLNEMIETARSERKGSGGGAAASRPAPAAAAAPSGAAAKPAAKKPSARAPSPAEQPEAMDIDTPSTSAPPGRKQKGPPPLTSTTKSKTAQIKTPKLTGPAPGEDDASLASGSMGKEDAEGKLEELFGSEAIAGLRDSVWKKRMEALDAIIAAAKDMEIPPNTRVIVNAVSHLPGWTEKNFQVMSRQFELIRYCAENGESRFTRSEAFVSIKGLVEKMGDIKLKTPAAEALSMICEAVGPQFVFDQMHLKASAHKNPKVLAETLNWMSKAVSEFGLGVMDTKNLINWVQVDVASTNPAVRNAAVALAGCMHSFVGPALGDLLQAGVKPAQMATMEQAFAKNPQITDFVPTRTPRTGAANKQKPAKGGKAGAAAPALDPDELLPRADISSQITSSLTAELMNSNWKMRKAGLEQVEGIISEAGNRIQPNVGDLMNTLKGITKDSNRNLAATGIKIVGKIATAMGKAIDRQGRPVLGPALLCISDTKTLVRAAVIEMLGAWEAVAGTASLLPEIATAAAAPKCSADGKKDLVNWVTGLIQGGKDVHESLDQIVKLVAVACSDKSAGVRDAGNNLMQQLVEKFGSEVGDAAQSLDGALKKAAIEAVKKVGGGVSTSAAPEKPSTAKPAPAGAAGKSVGAIPKRPPSGGGTRNTKIARPSGGKAGGKAKDDKMEVDEQPLFVLSDQKDARARKNRGKRAKFEGIPPDEAELLKHDLEPLVSATISRLLFSTDFKHHCQAADMIKASVESLYDEVLSCVDLIFRWAVMRIVEGNTQCLVKTLDMLKTLLEAMPSREYKLSEYEGIILMPVVVEKSGHNQDRIKKAHRELMVLVTKVLPSTKVFVYLADGLESKNNRTKVECAEEIGAMIDREGMKVTVTTKKIKPLPLIAQAVSARDKAFRQATLGTLEVIYDFEGEAIWKLLGRLTDQQRSLIEERLKVRTKQLAKEGLAPGFRNENAAERMEDPVVEVRAPPPPEGVFVPPQQRGAFGAAVRSPENSALRASTGSIPSLNNGGLNAPAGGRLPAPTNVGGIPRPGNYMPSPGSAMELSPRTDSPDRTSPLPDPPEVASGYVNVGHQTGDRGRTDAEIEDTWTRAMVTMVGGPFEESVDALKVLCFELIEASKGRCSENIVGLMTHSADELVRELVIKIDVIFCEAAAQTVSAPDPPSNRGCKYTLNTMMQVFGIPEMARMIQRSTLKDTLGCLLTLLLDDRLPRVHEGTQLMKAMNVLVLRMLEMCNKNALFSVLLELLRNLPTQIQGSSLAIQDKFLNLVIKCLIKMTKSMGSLLMEGSEQEEIDIRELMGDIHLYFTALGADEIRKRGEEEDKPLKMVKTILHEICRHKGASVVDYVGDIPRNEDPPPIILAYIDLNLQTLHNTGIISGTLPAAFSQTNSHVISQYFGSIEAAQSPRSHDQNPPVSPDRSAGASTPVEGHDTMKTELAAIFKKIGDKSLSKEGMEDLYRFQQGHQNVDVMPYLSNTSDAFRAYIERGLQRIHAKGGPQGTYTQAPVRAPVPMPLPAVSPASSPIPSPASSPIPSSGRSPAPSPIPSPVPSPVDEMEVDEGPVEYNRCPTPTSAIPEVRTIPRPGGIPRPGFGKPVSHENGGGGDQVRSLRDFRNNRFGRRE